MRARVTRAVNKAEADNHGSLTAEQKRRNIELYDTVAELRSQLSQTIRSEIESSKSDMQFEQNCAEAESVFNCEY